MCDELLANKSINIFNKKISFRKFKAFLWCITIFLGLIYMWHFRHYMNPDGISYLDMADSYINKGLVTALNGYWSSLYPAILGLGLIVFRPDPYWEFFITHLINFIFYLISFWAFNLFLSQVLFISINKNKQLIKGDAIMYPVFVWIMLSNSLFLWGSLRLIKVHRTTPDMLLSIFLYLIFAILLKIKRKGFSLKVSVALGLVLGLSYLTKVIMFPISIIVLGIAFILARNKKANFFYKITTLVIFIAISGSFICFLSNSKGRFTYGDKGRIAYSWYMNNVPDFVHWQGDNPENGIPTNPTRKLFNEPSVYEFDEPIEGTYSPWYNPSYWHEGVRAHFNFKSQLRHLYINISTYLKRSFLSMQFFLFLGACLLYFLRKGSFKYLIENGYILLLIVVTLGLYSLILLQARYIAVFLVVFWITVYSRVLSSEYNNSKTVNSLILIPILFSGLVVMAAIPKTYSIYDSFVNGEDKSKNINYLVVQALKDNGITDGGKIAYIGDSFKAYWARMARVRIIAEIKVDEVDQFWLLNDELKDEIINVFKNIGAKAILSKDIPNYVNESNWQNIKGTDCYIYVFKNGI